MLFYDNIYSNCQILDCEVKVHGSKNSGIAYSLQRGTVVERCIVSGSGSVDYGIAKACDNSVVRHCAIGPLAEVNYNRIVIETRNGGRLEHNISIESHSKQTGDDGNGLQGKTVAAALFTQRYFELTLGWDFEQVWQWDHQNNVPTLRQVGVTAAVPKTTTTEQTPKQDGEKMVDLLALQLKDNLWI